jgi:hypothetical protein
MQRGMVEKRRKEGRRGVVGQGGISYNHRAAVSSSSFLRAEFSTNRRLAGSADRRGESHHRTGAVRWTQFLGCVGLGLGPARRVLGLLGAARVRRWLDSAGVHGSALVLRLKNFRFRFKSIFNQ